MTQKQISEQYYKIYKQLEKSAKAYKKKYDIDITLPRKVKKPTQKSIERLKSYKKEQQRQARVKAYWIREHAFEAEVASISRIYDIVNTGLRGNTWEAFKAQQVKYLLDEMITQGNDERSRQRRIAIARHIDEHLQDLDDRIQRFIMESQQEIDDYKSQVTWLWGGIVTDILHLNVNITDDSVIYDMETGEIYE